MWPWINHNNNSVKIERIKSMKTKLILIAALALISTVVKSNAQIAVDLDSVDANLGPVDATTLLASYGITLTNLTNPVSIWSDTNITYLAASPGTNFLLQQVGGSPDGISYTLDFSTPLTSFSFTRIASVDSNAVAQWTATAYDNLTSVGSVGEAAFGGTEASADYTLSGADITSVTITANGSGYAGISSAPLDNIVLTQAVPEPSTWAMLTGGVGSLLLFRRRRSS